MRGLMSRSEAREPHVLPPPSILLQPVVVPRIAVSECFQFDQAHKVSALLHARLSASAQGST